MKKINCILLTITLLLQFIPIRIQAAEKEDKKLDILIGIGILSGYSQDEFNENSYVSSGAFVNAVLNLIQNGESFDSSASERSIALAEERGLLKGISDFQKQRSIKCAEALDILVRAVGYHVLLEQGATLGYVASQMGVTTVPADMESALTNKQLVEMLYEVLEANPLVLVKKDRFEFDTDRTILETFRDIYKIKGLVTQNSYTDLTDDSVSTQPHIVIGGIECGISSAQYDEFLGMNVEAYIMEKNMEYALVYATPEKNNLLNIKREDVLSIDDAFRNMEYEDGMRTRDIEISPIVRVIYNGNIYTEYAKEDFLSHNGELTLIDNNGDKVYDVIKIKAYKTIVAKSVSSFDGIITNYYTYDKENKSITVDYHNPDVEYIIIKNGRNVSLNEIQNGDVLQIAEPKSDQKQKVFIYVSSVKIEGEVTEIFTDKKTRITVDNKDYVLSDIYASAVSDSAYTPISLGNYYKLYLNTFGEVAYVKEMNFNVSKCGFMTKIFLDDAGDGCYIQLYTTDGEWKTYPLNEKINYCGQSCTDEYVFGDLTNTSGKLAQEQMVSYKINKDNEIQSLQTAQTAAGYVEGVFTQRVVTGDEYRSEAAMLLQNEIFFAEDTVIMLIPENKSDKNSYSVRNLSYLRNGETGFTYTVYNVDEWNQTSLISIISDDSVKTRSVENSDLCLVESLGMAVNSENEICQRVTVYQPHYGKVTLLSNEEDLFTGVNPGDILQLATDVNSVVTAVRTAHSFTDYENRVKEAGNKSNFRYATNKLAGEVIDINPEKNLIKFDCGETHYYALNAPDAYYPFDVIIYDTGRNRIENGTIYDIRTGDYIVADMSWYLISSVIIYR